MNKIDNIITEEINSYVSHVMSEDSDTKHKGNETVGKKHKKDSDTKHKDKEGVQKKDKKFRKNAIKGKGGIRKDFDVDDEKQYNQNVDDMEQGEIEDFLKSGFINRTEVAKQLYPDHTDTGAESQLVKKLNGAKSDSGSTYKLKKKEVKKLRNIIATFLNQ
jgi:hypothetical protein